MIRLLRGRVAIREIVKESVIWNPDPKSKQVKTHRGVVLGLGAPALEHGHEVTPGFAVGDTVQFHFVHNRDGFTRPWPEDGLEATFVPQSAVDLVFE